jgi:hypothetical protein
MLDDKAAYEAVSRAVQQTREATGEAPTSEEPIVEDFGNLTAEPLLKFAEAAAVHIERCGAEVQLEATKLAGDCQRLANNIREVARGQADAILRATKRNRKAAAGLTTIRDEFRTDVAEEIAAFQEQDKAADAAAA